MPIRANSHKNQLSSPDSVRWTLLAPTRLCPTASNIVRVTLDIVQNSKISPMASFLRELYKYPHSSNSSLSLSLFHMIFLVLKLILSISEVLKHSTLEHPLQVLDLGIE
jgi:hypothetical protein